MTESNGLCLVLVHCFYFFVFTVLTVKFKTLLVNSIEDTINVVHFLRLWLVLSFCIKLHLCCVSHSTFYAAKDTLKTEPDTLSQQAP